MALARVVTFEGVTQERIEELRGQMESGERPENLPAKEMLVLFDAAGERSLVVIFFENEDDYRVGDATLNAMPGPDTPGSRTSVSKYDVAIHVKV